MNSTELFRLVESGTKPVVQFHKGIEDQETCIDRGMYGRIVEVRHEHADVYRMSIDLNDFEAHNDGVAQHNYYDGDGNPTLTAKEAGQYPSNGIETFYVDYDRDLSDTLTLDESGVGQIVSVKITSAVVYRNEGQPDTIIVDTPAPMPIAGLPGNVKLTLIADEGTGVEYMKEHFGITCTEEEGGPDYEDILASYGIEAA